MLDHLDSYWANRGLEEKGWERCKVDDLHTVVSIPASRPDGTIDRYYVKLGAEYYDAYPPTVLFVSPDHATWPRARAGSTWWPTFTSTPNWFQLHDSSNFHNNGTVFASDVQLVCFSMTAEYYMSGHSPTEAQRWVPGRRTVAATLSRLHEVLSPPYYGGPGAPRHP
jgi:hypothetical protein